MRLEIRGVIIEDLTLEEADDVRRQLVAEPPRSSHRWEDSGAITTAEAAKRLGMSTEYIRDHAADLGGTKRGNVWRFDPAKLEAVTKNVGESPTISSTQRRRRKRVNAPLLEVRGKSPYASVPKLKAAPGGASTPTRDLRQRRV
jgi:hypothetical protein